MRVLLKMYYRFKISSQRILCLFSTLTMCYISLLAAKNSGQEPPWVKGEFPQNTNGTYHFMTAEGIGSTLKESRKDADMVLVTEIMLSAGVDVSGSGLEKTLSKMNNGSLDEQHESDYRYDFTMGNVRMAFKAVDVFWEYKNSRYECNVLYEVANNPDNVVYQPVECTDKYGARGLWRSAIIPGWGQMYKKQYVKGICILAVEAAGVASSLIFENQRSSYCNKAAVNFDADAIKFYQNKANDAKNARNICIIGTAAVYVYNLVDAFAAKGKPRYKKPSSSFISLTPYSTTESPMGLSLCYTF